MAVIYVICMKQIQISLYKRHSIASSNKQGYHVTSNVKSSHISYATQYIVVNIRHYSVSTCKKLSIFSGDFPIADIKKC